MRNRFIFIITRMQHFEQLLMSTVCGKPSIALASPRLARPRVTRVKLWLVTTPSVSDSASLKATCHLLPHGITAQVIQATRMANFTPRVES